MECAAGVDVSDAVRVPTEAAGWMRHDGSGGEWRSFAVPPMTVAGHTFVCVGACGERPECSRSRSLFYNLSVYIPSMVVLFCYLVAYRIVHGDLPLKG
jgi:hypothetical protein